jgi:hypothetical protein
MGAHANVLDNPSVSRPARYLRDHRFRLTLWIAAVEGLLVVFHAISSVWLVYALAVIAIGFWVAVARKYRSATARNASWIFAASQALAVLIPIALDILKWVAFGAIALIAVAALVILFAERGRA